MRSAQLQSIRFIVLICFTAFIYYSTFQSLKAAPLEAQKITAREPNLWPEICNWLETRSIDVRDAKKGM